MGEGKIFAELVGGKGGLAGCPIRTTELQPPEEIRHDMRQTRDG
jgi:hypothetical protein